MCGGGEEGECCMCGHCLYVKRQLLQVKKSLHSYENETHCSHSNLDLRHHHSHVQCIQDVCSHNPHRLNKTTHMAAYPQSLLCMSGEGSRWRGCRTSENRDSQTSEMPSIGRVYKANLESQLFRMESQLNQAIARDKACSHRSTYTCRTTSKLHGRFS